MTQRKPRLAICPICRKIARYRDRGYDIMYTHIEEPPTMYIKEKGQSKPIYPSCYDRNRRAVELKP